MIYLLEASYPPQTVWWLLFCQEVLPNQLLQLTGCGRDMMGLSV